MSEPVNPPVEPPFNLMQAIKAQPNPTNIDWDYVRERKEYYGKVLLENFSNKPQLAALMAESRDLRFIILTNEDASLFHAIMDRAIQNWNAANAANPVQGSLAEVYKEVVSGHQEEVAF